MKAPFLPLAALIIGLLVAVAPARVQADGAEGLRDVMHSVVSVLPRVPQSKRNNDEPEGSGVVVFDGRYVVTALHVITHAREVVIRSLEGEVMRAEIIGRDKATDLALLEIDKALKPVRFGHDPEVGSQVVNAHGSHGDNRA